MQITKPKLIIVMILVFSLYLAAFVEVHCSATLRKPAANMAYWYYSDNPVIENLGFYGFWPLRQLSYHVPGFEARHNDELIWKSIRACDRYLIHHGSNRR